MRGRRGCGGTCHLLSFRLPHLAFFYLRSQGARQQYFAHTWEWHRAQPAPGHWAGD